MATVQTDKDPILKWYFPHKFLIGKKFKYSEFIKNCFITLIKQLELWNYKFQINDENRIQANWIRNKRAKLAIDKGNKRIREKVIRNKLVKEQVSTITGPRSAARYRNQFSHQ